MPRGDPSQGRTTGKLAPAEDLYGRENRNTQRPTVALHVGLTCRDEIVVRGRLASPRRSPSRPPGSPRVNESVLTGSIPSWSATSSPRT